MGKDMMGPGSDPDPQEAGCLPFMVVSGDLCIGSCISVIVNHLRFQIAHERGTTLLPSPLPARF